MVMNVPLFIYFWRLALKSGWSKRANFLKAFFIFGVPGQPIRLALPIVPHVFHAINGYVEHLFQVILMPLLVLVATRVGDQIGNFGEQFESLERGRISRQ